MIQQKLHQKNKWAGGEPTQAEIEAFHPATEICTTCGRKYYSKDNAFACCRTMDPELRVRLKNDRL